MVGALGVAILVAVWEMVSRLGLLTPDVAPSFLQTVAELGALVVDPRFQSSLGFTLRSWVIGFVITASLAVPVGLFFGVNTRAWRWFRSTFEAVRPIPPIVVLPLAILVLGAGTSFTTVMIMQGVFWLILIQVTYGTSVIPAVTVDTAKVFHVGILRRYALFRLPSAAPIITTGLRIAAGISLAVQIMSELIGGVPGIGQMLISAQAGNDIPRIYALTAFTGLLGLAVALALRAAERWLLRNFGPGGGAE
ncbi:ABC transporter permease [Ornithinimicrobium cavernae]|uniref:ABC transporter permease n=1 Tax=Ornithinimicrobium cavernae TaxID=2666047 RepID=UPI001379E6C3|nr:ABC transporter permease subunit [Ornithinimicrobium cavernae]